MVIVCLVGSLNNPQLINALNRAGIFKSLGLSLQISYYTAFFANVQNEGGFASLKGKWHSKNSKQ